LSKAYSTAQKATYTEERKQFYSQFDNVCAKIASLLLKAGILQNSTAFQTTTLTIICSKWL
jgi:hypothetical protein